VPTEAERIEILKMVQAKQITPEDGARLLKALADDKALPTPPRPVPPPVRPAPPAPPGVGGPLFKLLVEDPNGERVNVAVPLGAVPLMLRFAARWVPEQHRGALEAAAEAVTSGFRGDIVHVEQPDGERVRIWIE